MDKYKVRTLLLCPIIVLWVLLSFIKESIKYIFKGKNTAGRITLISIYLLLTVLVVMGKLPIIGIVSGIIYGIILLICSIRFILKKDINVAEDKEDQAKEEKEGNKEKYKKDTNFDTTGSLFTGMSKEAAKKKYRELIKKYHPDNKGGDQEICKRINTEYRRFSSGQY